MELLGIAYVSSRRRYRVLEHRRGDRTTLFLDIDNKKRVLGIFYARLLRKIREGDVSRPLSVYCITFRYVVALSYDGSTLAPSTIYDSIRASSFYRKYGTFWWTRFCKILCKYIYISSFMLDRIPRREDEAKYITGDNVKCALTFACIGQRSVKFKRLKRVCKTH